MTKKEFWKKMEGHGVTRDIFCHRLGMSKDSIYAWPSVPKYALYILEWMNQTKVDVEDARKFRQLKSLWGDIEVMLDA